MARESQKGMTCEGGKASLWAGAQGNRYCCGQEAQCVCVACLRKTTESHQAKA